MKAEVLNSLAYKRAGDVVVGDVLIHPRLSVVIDVKVINQISGPRVQFRLLLCDGREWVLNYWVETRLKVL